MALSKCWTQPGDVAAAGWITDGAMPRGIDAWPWRMPSKIQRIPNEILSNLLAGASGALAVRSLAWPWRTMAARRNCADLVTLQAAATNNTISATTRPWRSSSL